ncbi:MAG TPA: tetratricopeptide repeat protein [Candidatus Angelobacter sp.]|nr:tetratricopeptide repeat protein [Candidatus Angelobacter sp.]
MPALLLIFALAPFFATVSGQVLDREGHPLTGATVTYKYIGTVDKQYQKIPGGLYEDPKMLERGGRTFTTKTSKKGAFSMTGLEYGVYQVEITGPDGMRVYSGRKVVGDPGDENSRNLLNVDLSTVYRGPAEPGESTSLAEGKKTKEQLELVRQENAHGAKINRLIVRYHAELDLQDWAGAMAVLKELIALDNHRWEFYQNLGTLQANQGQNQEAVQNYAKAVEVARRTLANATDTDRALSSIGDLLLAQADAYERLGRIDEAVAAYDQAALNYPRPFMAHYRACNTLANNGRPDEAIEKCNQALTDDPARWEPYQLLGGIFAGANKPNDAVAAYQNGVTAARKAVDAQPQSLAAKVGLGQMLNAAGNLLVQQKKYEEALPVFSEAAEASAYPAMPYFNLCATHYNLKRLPDALAACDRAIASDPRMADAYYIKAVILFGQGEVEHGKFVAPPGAAEALNKYLEFDPEGTHASAVREMINQLDRPVRTNYSAPRK